MRFVSILNNLFCILTRKLHPFNGKRLHVASKILSKSSHELSSESIMKVLNVAEKNDAAKNIALILSKGTNKRREGFSKYNKIYEFDCRVLGQNCKMVMTSVSGHLLNWEFTGMYRGWQKCQPVQLFDAPVIKSCPDESANKIKKTLEKEVKYCNVLIIWTDCDREGENIGFEIIGVCKDIKPNIEIYRAKFSEITKQSIWTAVERLDRPKKLLSDAVDVRSELDLRIGAAFTRFQTLRLKRVFPDKLADCLISYGSCQFPTLGFVVERYNEIQNFVPEDFWKIKVEHKIDQLNVEFFWKRVRLFDHLFCRVLYERCLEKPEATVEKVVSKPKSKWRPLPLDTIEFEKMASKKLGLNAKEAMKIAEKLYTQGFISYPRTETNIFPKQLRLDNLVADQVNDPNWGDFARRIMEDGPNPRQGKKTDEAHPPIHPTKYAGDLHGSDKKVYEFIVRRFLACVSKDAKGHETVVDIDINAEKFVARGLMILERNYLDVYPYEKWSDKEIHIYQEGQKFNPTIIDIVEGKTKPPNLLTEADLIALMEKHGIGTDATHAEHIETIKKRLYVGLNDSKYFVPGQLGMGLVEGYDSMGFAMSKPHLRAELEVDLKRISEGQKAPEVVLREQVQKYKEVFIQAQLQVEKIDAALGKYLEAAPQQLNADEVTEHVFNPVLKCPSCGQYLVLKKRNTGGFYLGCVGFPDCKTALWFPNSVLNVEVAPTSCPECGPEVKQLEFNFRPGALAPFYPNRYTGCVNGCDDRFLDLLGTKSLTSQVGDHTVVSNNRATAVRSDAPQQQQNNWGQTNTSPPRNNRFNIGPNNEDNGNGGDDESEIKCNCGLPAIRLIVQKESVNKGRPFYKCGKPTRDEACNFFQWGDNQDRGGGRGGRGGGGSSITQIRPDATQQHQNNWRLTNTSPPRNRRFNIGPNDDDNDDESEVKCNCRLPAIRLIVQKESVNKGRPFYKCGKQNRDEACNFFQWADDQDNNQANNRPSQNNYQPRGRGRVGSGSSFTQRSTRGGGGGGGNQRKCGICHRTGHTRRNCPNA